MLFKGKRPGAVGTLSFTGLVRSTGGVQGCAAMLRGRFFMSMLHTNGNGSRIAWQGDVANHRDRTGTYRVILTGNGRRRPVVVEKRLVNALGAESWIRVGGCSRAVVAAMAGVLADGRAAATA